MDIRVECYAGYKAGERPLRFSLGQRVIEVVNVLDRWYGPDASYFRVEGSDGDLYVLKHMVEEARWELSSFTRRGSHGTATSLPPRRRILH